MDPTALTGNAAIGASLQQQAASQAAALKSAASASPAKGQAAAKQFEGFFVSQMMDNMMAGIEPDEMFGGGFAEETWRSMLNQEYGKEIAKSGRLGIANSVLGSMLKAQEQANGNASGASATNAADQTGAAATGAPSTASAATAAAAYTAAALPPAKLN